MKLKDVLVLKEVVDDLNDGEAFYEENESGLGDWLAYDLGDKASLFLRRAS